jgi:hypothetical protein
MANCLAGWQADWQSSWLDDLWLEGWLLFLAGWLSLQASGCLAFWQAG